MKRENFNRHVNETSEGPTEIPEGITFQWQGTAEENRCIQACILGFEKDNVPEK